jgi:hypothetical protein
LRNRGALHAIRPLAGEPPIDRAISKISGERFRKGASASKASQPDAPTHVHERNIVLLTQKSDCNRPRSLERKIVQIAQNSDYNRFGTLTPWNYSDMGKSAGVASASIAHGCVLMDV